MKKRPVLSIGIFLLFAAVTVREQKKSHCCSEHLTPAGRNNVTTGVAKVIKTHFKKHSGQPPKSWKRILST
jgi:hypothetical protein